MSIPVKTVLDGKWLQMRCSVSDYQKFYLIKKNLILNFYSLHQGGNLTESQQKHIPFLYRHHENIKNST